MAEQSLWQRVIAAIEGEYERRIRRASLVREYGADQHGHGDHVGHPPAAPAAEPEPGEEAAIVNLPKGAPLGRRAPAEPPPDPTLPPG